MSKIIADISHYRPVTNWSKAKADCSFLISKATQGTNFVDSTLQSFIKGCEQNKIPYWLYTYLNAGGEKAQVEFLLKTCKPLVGDHFVGYILDVEAGNKAKDVKEALQYLESQTQKVMLYTMYGQYTTYKSVIESKGANTAWWEARYGKNDGTYSELYSSHSGVDLHQYTSAGTTSFTSGKTDLNRLTGLKQESWFTSKGLTLRKVAKVEDTVNKEVQNMPVKVGSARIDENGRAVGGRAGDQTGKEVATENWYLSSLGWVVLRPKEAKLAENLAYAMERACANNKIGYDQGQRNTLFALASSVGYDPGKVSTACETDCSALVRVCLHYAGLRVGDFNTSTMVKVILATGKFEQRPDAESKAEKYMKRGDILVTKKKGHTVIVLSNGSSAPATNTPPSTPTSSSSASGSPAAASGTKSVKAADGAQSFSKSYNKTYKTTVKCNVRDGAGKHKKVLTVVPAGVSARCYGYYTTYQGTKWMYVVLTYNKVTYTAFISSACLK